VYKIVENSKFSEPYLNIKAIEM